MFELYIGGHAQGKLEYVRYKYTEGFQQKDSHGALVNRLRIVDGENVEELEEALKDAFKEAFKDISLDASGALVQEYLVVNHLHLWVRELLRRGEDPEMRLESLLPSVSDCVLISDEVGNGIVPVEPQEREYREVLGRILIKMAVRADRVERVICGLGQRLK